VLLAFGVATAVGVFFGWYPADSARALDPIVAPDDVQISRPDSLVPSTSARRSPCARSIAIASAPYLTMLGVIIGVAAVIAMVALGSGARGSVETSLKSAGTNIIQVSAGNFTRGGESMNIASGLGSATTLTLEDAGAIRGIDGVQHVAGGVRNRAFVKSSHRQFFTQVRGVEPALADIPWMGMARRLIHARC
jgi:ABC-type antimicrobial peptide transport system permease subunit